MVTDGTDGPVRLDGQSVVLTPRLRKVLLAQARNRWLKGDEAERNLARFFGPFLEARTAIDVGAHKGDFSTVLLDAGFETFAFEASPGKAQQLRSRFADRPDFHLFAVAAADHDGSIDLSSVEQVADIGDRPYDTSLLSTVVRHPMIEQLRFGGTIRIPARRLDPLAAAGLLPSRPGILKIDAEGYDRSVLLGAATLRPQIVVVEYWGRDFVFNGGATANDVADHCGVMKGRGYPLHLVVGQDATDNSIRWAACPGRSVPNSWGNVFFFESGALFDEALGWASEVIGLDRLA